MHSTVRLIDLVRGTCFFAFVLSWRCFELRNRIGPWDGAKVPGLSLGLRHC